MWLALLAWLLCGPVQAQPGTGVARARDVRAQEAPIGDLVADAIAAQAGGQADLALINAAQFGPDAALPDRLTAAGVASQMLKPNRPWVVSAIRGSSLLLAFERSLSRLPEPAAHFLQVSSTVRVIYDPDPEAPAGHRVISLAVGNQAVDPNRTYRVAMPEDLAKGASGYFTVPDFHEGTIQPQPNGNVAAAIAELIQQEPEASYTSFDRIQPEK